MTLPSRVGKGLVGKQIGLLAVIAFAAFGLALGAGGTAAAPQSVALDTCNASATRSAVVTTGGDIALTGPTFLGKNRGSIQDFLNGNTTTFTVNGAASAAGSFSAPAAVTDPTYGAVWVTTWSASVAAPPVGAPARLSLQIALKHGMPQLLAPASDGGAFGADATFTRSCTLDGGQPVSSAGGTVRTADSAVTLAIPPAALTTTTTITIAPSTVTPPTSVGTPVATVYDFGPPGTTFAAPVPLALSYDPATVPASAVRSLHIAGLSNGAWRLRPSTVDTATHAVSALISHFSSYAIVQATCTGFIVGGTVTDGLGPVLGAQAQEITTSLAIPAATDFTDLNGEYAFCVPDLSTVKLRFEPPSGSTLASQWYSGSTLASGATAIAVNAADVLANNVVLGPGSPVTGVVTDRATGLPLANAFVGIHRVAPDGSCCSFATIVERTTTDTTGRYHASLPAGSYKLIGIAPTGADYVNQWWPDAPSPFAASTLVVPSTASAADVSFALAPGYRIHGTVTDSANAVIPDAFVQAQVATGSGKPQNVGGGGTDATGTYSFVVPAGTYLIQFVPPQNSSFVGQYWNNKTSFAAADPLTVSATQPAPSTGVNAVLATGYIISGTLRDASTNALLNGGNVQANTPPPPGGCCPQFAGGTGVNTDGTFRFAVLPGTYILRANGPSSATYVSSWYGDGNDPNAATRITVDALTPAAGTGLTVALQPGFVISGTLRDAVSLAPIPNANINVQTRALPGQCCPQNAGGAGTAGDGTFRTVVPAGSYIVYASPQYGSTYIAAYLGDGNDPASATTITVNTTTPAAGTAIDFRLQTGFLISGTLRDAGSGATIGNTGLNISLPPPSGGCCPQFVNKANVRGDGTFSVAMPAGTYIVRANAPQGTLYVSAWYGDGNDPGRATQLVLGPATPGAGANLDIRLTLGFEISGTLRDAGTNAIIPGGNVQANLPPPPGGCCPQNVAGTGVNTDGTFRFAVPAGTYILRANPPQGSTYISIWYGDGQDPAAATTITVNGTTPAAGTALTIALQPGYVISGVIRDAVTLAPIPNANIGAATTPPGGACCPRNVAGANTDGGGNFRMVVAAGTYILHANPPQGSAYLSSWYGGGDDFHTATPVTVNAVTPTAGTGLTVGLEAGYVISGHVRASGVGVGGVQINANGGPIGGTWGGHAQSNGDGSYSLVVRAGSYLLQVQGPPSGPAYVSQWWPSSTSDWRLGTVVTRNATTTTPPNAIDIDLLAGFRITGQVTDPGNAPVARVGVTAQDASVACCRDIAAWGSDYIGGGTDGNGMYSLVVPAGSYKLSFYPNCCQPPSPTDRPFLSQYWSGRTSFDTADTLVVSATQPPPATGVNVTLVVGARISGRVVAAGTTTGLGGVNVNLTYAPTSPNTCCNGAGGTQTAADGSFTLVAVPGSSYVIGYAGGRSNYVFRWYDGALGTRDVAGATVLSPTGDVPGLQLQATLGYRISGHVSQPGGAAAPRVGVHAPNPDGSGGCGGGCGQTDPNGDFDFAIDAGSWIISFDPNQLNQLLGTAYIVQFWDGRSSPAGATLINAVAGGSQGGIIAVLPQGYRLGGQVVLSGTTTAAGGVPIGASFAPASANTCCVGADGTQSAANGSFGLIVGPGRYVLGIGGGQSSYLFRWVDGTPEGTNDVNAATVFTVTNVDTTTLQLSAVLGLRITGRVTDAATTGPLANAEVNATTSRDGCCYVGGTRTDTNGNYSLVVPGGGSYYVRFGYDNVTTAYVAQLYNGAPSFAAATAVSGPAGATLPNINAALATGVIITGTLTNAGVGLSNINVSANDGGPGALCCLPALHNARTNGSGVYRLAVPTGGAPYRIGAFPDRASAYRGAYYSTTTPNTEDFYLATDVTGPAASIDIVLSTGVHLRGIVTSGGLGVGGISVSAHRLTTNGQCCDRYAGGQTASDGSYDLVVTSGTWRVRFNSVYPSRLVGTWYGSADDFNTATNIPVGTTEVSGISVSLSSGVWITGRLFGPDGVTPAVNVEVDAQTGAVCCKWSPLEAWTDGTGAYRVVVPASATYRVQANPDSQRTLWLRQWYSTTAPGTRDFAQGADVVVGTTDQPIGDMTLRQGYAIRGRVTVGGVYTAFANAGVVDATTGAWVEGNRTQADGSYVVVVPAGSYKVSFDAPGHPQTWYGGVDFSTATAVTPPQLGVDGVVP